MDSGAPAFTSIYKWLPKVKGRGNGLRKLKRPKGVGRPRTLTVEQERRARGAGIYFWDESGFRADAVQGRTWCVKGKTPEIRVPGQRPSISAASAVNSKGGFWFTTHKGGLKDELVWSHVKRAGTGKKPLKAGEQLPPRVDANLLSLQNNPALIRAFFHTPHVSYIID